MPEGLITNQTALNRISRSAKKIANTILIDTNDQVDQNKWSKSKTVTIDDNGEQRSGEIIAVLISTIFTGTGVLLRNALDLVIFDVSPAFTVSNVDHYENSGNEGDNESGHIHFPAGNWLAASDGTDEIATGFLATAHPFVTDSTGLIYIATINRGATAYNSAAADDEIVRAAFLIKFYD